jgi:hypothetical protein
LNEENQQKNKSLTNELDNMSKITTQEGEPSGSDYENEERPDLLEHQTGANKVKKENE